MNKMAKNLTEKQSIELCEVIGKMLALELESDTLKGKVKKVVADYVKKSKLDIDSTAVAARVHWHVQVTLKK